LAARLGLTERVHFLGHRDDIPALIRASQATLLPSEREGLPRSIMESLCLEVPVIGSDIRGIRDLLADGAGLMYTVGDIKGLAAAMDWILGHPREAALMARRGREQLMAAGRSQADIINRHEELYAVALNRRQAS
jgi:glycosyltransferase involved in cell wall biosynthesis